MAAYVVASFTIANQDGYETYRAAVIQTFAPHGCEVVVADYASEVIEGQPGKVTVVLKFASKEAAWGWYNSPEYQAILHLRTDNSEGSVVLVDGWAP